MAFLVTVQYQEAYTLRTGSTSEIYFDELTPATLLEAVGKVEKDREAENAIVLYIYYFDGGKLL